MCGILVDLRFRGPHPVEALHVGLDTLRPRGPDDCRALTSGPAWFGHTRLAMVQRALGAQPLVDRVHDLVAVVNGELYNAEALAEQLRSDGLVVPEGSDARVVLPLYRRHGPDFVHHLEGEWAVVVWDGRRQRLVAARDPFGVRPLFLATDPDGIRLASSAEALIAAGHVPRWSRDAVARVFQHQYMLPGDTVFDGVSAVLPGGRLVVQDARVRSDRWWSLPLSVDAPPATGTDLLGALSTAVERRLRADVPLGVQLSGGVDSATVAALAARHAPGLTAWTIAFSDDPGRDESGPAQVVARAAGLDHRVVSMTRDDLLDDLFASVVAGGAPVINLHGAARYRLARQVRAAGVRGLLTGEGADELLFGYAHLRHDHALAGGPLLESRDEPVAAAVHLPTGPRLDTAPVRAVLGQVPTFIEAKAALAVRARSLLTRPDAWPTGFSGLVDALHGGTLAVPEGGSAPARSAWLWTHLCLSGSILAVLCDPQELAHGVEGRLPFLDRDVVATALAIPAADKLRGGVEKRVLRDAVVGLVPDTVRRRPKQPFMAPPIGPSPALDRLLGSVQLPAFLSRDGLEDALARVASVEGPERNAWDAVACMGVSLAILHTAHGMRDP